MNREETKEAIEVMQGFIDGCKIEQAEPQGKWKDDPDPIWNWAYRQYRIKPRKPRTTFVVWKGTQSIRVIELTDEVKEAIEDAGIEYGE